MTSVSESSMPGVDSSPSGGKAHQGLDWRCRSSQGNMQTMWKSVWLALSVPFCAVFTGRVFGYSASRNPFRWLSMLMTGLLLIPFTILVYPVLLVVMYVSYWIAFRKGLDAKLTDDGITVFSRLRGELAHHEWSEILGMREVFAPPITYPLLQLSNGETVHLQSAGLEDLAAALKQRGIPVNLTPRSHTARPAPIPPKSSA